MLLQPCVRVSLCGGGAGGGVTVSVSLGKCVRLFVFERGGP